MKFIFGYPFFSIPPNPLFLNSNTIGELAQTMEKAGIEAAFFSEHPIPSNSWRESDGHDALDPFVALSFAAASTNNLKLLTNLTIVPYRNPFLLAKAAATLDVLSGGRLILGLGTGYLKAEYFALGVDFEERNELFDEAVEVMKQVWTGDPVNYEGKHFSAKDVVGLPTPAQSPHPPLWLGGNSKLTRRRIASWGQGWLPMPNPPKFASRRRSAPLETNAELAEMIAYMKDYADSIGREDPIDIGYMTMAGGIPGTKGFELDRHLEDVAELAELGVTQLAVLASSNTPGQAIEPGQVMDQIEFIGKYVIPPCRDL